MKKIIISSLAILFLGITACEPIPTCDQMLGFKVVDVFGGKEIKELTFFAEGGTQSLYIETVSLYWRARIWSNIDGGEIDTHPSTGILPNDYIEIENVDGWMRIKYKHAMLHLFNGIIEVEVDPVAVGSLGPSGEREDAIYIWNDDFLTTRLGITINVVQEDVAGPV
ncbi:MAG: hypothetical protein FWD56_02170 [Bacteroidales bacterium]|nr:hypothetical protein [Bacteroidales bacterium]